MTNFPIKFAAFQLDFLLFTLSVRRRGSWAGDRECLECIGIQWEVEQQLTDHLAVPYQPVWSQQRYHSVALCKCCLQTSRHTSKVVTMKTEILKGTYLQCSLLKLIVFTVIFGHISTHILKYRQSMFAEEATVASYPDTCRRARAHSTVLAALILCFHSLRFVTHDLIYVMLLHSLLLQWFMVPWLENWCYQLLNNW